MGVFIEKHLALIEENRELAEVIQIELRQSHKFMKEYSGTKFRDYVNIISAIIAEGQKKGDFREDIIQGMDGNLCRCGSHLRVVQAIETAAKEMEGGKWS